MSSNLNIIYEDQFLLAINKPSGLVVNRSKTWPDLTVQDLIEEYLPNFPIESESEFVSRSGVVHRIDKETSGLLLIAKDENTFLALQKSFKNREIEKTYVALVYGKFSSDLIDLDAPIKRNPHNRLKFAVVNGGKTAVTSFKKLAEYSWQGETLSLVEAKPKTGRTHQIRVHLAALNHPVVGDTLYLGNKRMELSRGIFNRMMLHAYSLKLKHPITQEDLFLMAEIPSEFSYQNNI